MARMGLIDVDGGKSFPNLALMKISAWHKAHGDDVSWYNPFDGWYDDVYLSKVFSFTPDYDYIIDADYRGEVGVTLYNLSREPYEIKPGDRIAQLVISPCIRANWEEVESLNTTGRNGGFGSTGK